MTCILAFLMSTYSVPLAKAWPVARELDRACNRMERALATDDYQTLDRVGDAAAAMLDANNIDMQLDEVCL